MNPLKIEKKHDEYDKLELRNNIYGGIKGCTADVVGEEINAFAPPLNVL